MIGKFIGKMLTLYFCIIFISFMVIDNVIFCKNVFKYGCGVIVFNIDYIKIKVF